MRTRTSPGSKCLWAGPSGTCMDTAFQFQKSQGIEWHNTVCSTISGMIKTCLEPEITTESTTSIPVSPAGETTRTICRESKLQFLSMGHGCWNLNIFSSYQGLTILESRWTTENSNYKSPNQLVSNRWSKNIPALFHFGGQDAGFLQILCVERSPFKATEKKKNRNTMMPKNRNKRKATVTTVKRNRTCQKYMKCCNVECMNIVRVY